MGEYQFDTFQRTARRSIQKKALFYGVAELSSATSFLISCIQCLWDSVRRFLGRCLQTPNSFKPMALRRPACAQGGRRCAAAPMLA